MKFGHIVHVKLYLQTSTQNASTQCTKHSPFTHTMHSDTTAKRVPKVSAKAQAALEETASKKRQADVNGDSVRIQPKKVKSNPPTGSVARTASKKNIAVSRSSPASSQQAVVHTEAEEEDSHSDNAKNDDVELVVTENEDESAADELSMFENLGNDIILSNTNRTIHERLDLTCVRFL